MIKKSWQKEKWKKKKTLANSYYDIAIIHEELSPT